MDGDVQLSMYFLYYSYDHLMLTLRAIRYQGHLLAKELAARGLQTTVITDSAVFAMISRVNMVCENPTILFGIKTLMQNLT